MELARKWIHAILGAVDEATGALLVTTQDATNNAHTGLGSKSVGAAWDADGDEMDIPDGVDSVLLDSTTDTYIIIDSLTADPATNGWILRAFTPVKLPCRGCTKIHYKRVSADGTLSASAIGE